MCSILICSIVIRDGSKMSPKGAMNHCERYASGGKPSPHFITDAKALVRGTKLPRSWCYLRERLGGGASFWNSLCTNSPVNDHFLGLFDTSAPFNTRFQSYLMCI